MTEAEERAQWLAENAREGEWYSVPLTTWIGVKAVDARTAEKIAHLKVLEMMNTHTEISDGVCRDIDEQASIFSQMTVGKAEYATDGSNDEPNY